MPWFIDRKSRSFTHVRTVLQAAAVRHSKARGAIAMLLTTACIAAFVTSARADYHDPSARAKATPADANKHYHPGPLYKEKSLSGNRVATTARKKPSTLTRSVEHLAVKPVGGPGPRRADGGTHALNPQPIPPGHAAALPLHPGAPLEKSAH